MKVFIQWQDQHFYWKPYRSVHHPPSAYREAKARAKRTGLRHRIVDERGNVMDLIDV